MHNRGIIYPYLNLNSVLVRTYHTFQICIKKVNKMKQNLDYRNELSGKVALVAVGEKLMDKNRIFSILIHLCTIN